MEKFHTRDTLTEIKIETIDDCPDEDLTPKVESIDCKRDNEGVDNEEILEER